MSYNLIPLVGSSSSIAAVSAASSGKTASAPVAQQSSSSTPAYQITLSPAAQAVLNSATPVTSATVSGTANTASVSASPDDVVAVDPMQTVTGSYTDAANPKDNYTYTTTAGVGDGGKFTDQVRTYANGSVVNYQTLTVKNADGSTSVTTTESENGNTLSTINEQEVPTGNGGYTLAINTLNANGATTSSFRTYTRNADGSMSIAGTSTNAKGQVSSFTGASEKINGGSELTYTNTAASGAITSNNTFTITSGNTTMTQVTNTSSTGKTSVDSTVKTQQYTDINGPTKVS